jgi:hypothetical protein
MRLVQLIHPYENRRVATVDGSQLILLRHHRSVYALANEAIAGATQIADLASQDQSTEMVEYDAVYWGRSLWRLLPPFDHPDDPGRCLVSGTGLTHKASAENRARMHQQQTATVTDSMRMYQLGLKGGMPAAGEIGVQPEWFYKGSGRILRAHGGALHVPSFAEDGGEEPEIAGVYLISAKGDPYRVGLATANEFSDHVMERQNYLYLAPSKLRDCAIGPELLTSELPPQHIEGKVTIERNSEALWSTPIYSGEKNMSHSIANLEHHHFKYEDHRHPGDVHIHFFGADAFSFGAGVKLMDGDLMEVSWPTLGRPLRNSIQFDSEPKSLIAARWL